MYVVRNGSEGSLPGKIGSTVLFNHSGLESTLGGRQDKKMEQTILMKEVKGNSLFIIWHYM
jgi:hypothetical protein